MYSSPEEIKTAIDAYRSRIAGHNRRILEVYVPFISQMELDPEEIESGDGDTKVQCFGTILGTHLDKFISKPEDVLARYDEFAHLCDLDGCGGPPPGTDARSLARVDSYFAVLERTLKETCLEEVRENVSVPEEFRIVAKHVAALTGPGLTENYKSRHESGFFWCGAGWAAEWGPGADRYTAASVKTPEQLNDSLVGHPWECAAGWDPGNNEWIIAAYCRPCECKRKSDESWAWRYISTEYGLVFETIPELLAWYCTFRENDIPNVEDLNELDAITGQFV